MGVAKSLDVSIASMEEMICEPSWLVIALPSSAGCLVDVLLRPFSSSIRLEPYRPNTYAACRLLGWNESCAPLVDYHSCASDAKKTKNNSP